MYREVVNDHAAYPSDNNGMAVTHMRVLIYTFTTDIATSGTMAYHLKRCCFLAQHFSLYTKTLPIVGLT